MASAFLYGIYFVAFLALAAVACMFAFLNGKLARQLREARTDVEIVKALRAGELDIEDLRETKLVEATLQEQPDPPSEVQVRRNVAATSAAIGKPEFRQRILRRAPEVGHLQPGEEVWIARRAIALTEDGYPVVEARHQTSLDPTDEWCVRMRIYHDGSVELGARAERCIHSSPAARGRQWRHVDRVVDLDSDDVRVFPAFGRPDLGEDFA